MNPTEQLAFFLAQANRALSLPHPDIAQARQTLRLATAVIHMGADVNVTLDFNLRPLHLACRAHAQLVRRCFRNSPESVALIEALLDAGADPSVRDHLPDGCWIGSYRVGCMMPAAYCEGYTPKALREAMEELAADGAWPEPNPGNQYDDDEVRPTSIGRAWNFVPQARVKRKQAA